MDKISIYDGWITVKGLGTVGLWWKYYDQKVCLSYGFGESFIAKTEEEVKQRIFKILSNG